MRRLAGIAMLGVSACLLMGAADGSWLRRVPAADHARANPLPDMKAAAEAGSHVYASECLHCHGEQGQGKGNRPPVVSERVRNATDGDLAWLLRNGNSWKGMPSWSSMPDARRWQVVAYLRSINQPASGAAESQGEQK
jgi:mono/diheme cytochrome c family protein